MARTTLASLAAQVAALTAALAAKSAPATPVVEAKVRTYATKAERTSGLGFACTATPACKRTDLRTAKRAALHGIEFGHTAR